jgi:hypothetical protein
MPPPKGFEASFNKLWKRFELFSASLNHQLQGVELTNEAMDRTISLLCEELRFDTHEQWSSVRELLVPYTSLTIGPSLYRNLIWRLAAGVERLAKGELVRSMFVVTPEPIWTGLTIEDVRHTYPSKTNKAQYRVSFRIHQGEFAGLLFSDTINARWVRYKLGRDIGFPRFKPMNQLEMVNCVFVGAVDLTDPDHPRLAEMHPSSSASSYNRRIRKQRDLPCARDYEWKCHACPVGHALAQPPESPCYRGTHSMTYVKKLCERCDKESWFDPGVTAHMCLLCQTKESRRHE